VCFLQLIFVTIQRPFKTCEESGGHDSHTLSTDNDNNALSRDPARARWMDHSVLENRKAPFHDLALSAPQPPPSLQAGQEGHGRSPYELAAVEIDQNRARLPSNFSVGLTVRVRAPVRSSGRAWPAAPAHVDIMLDNPVRGRLFPERPSAAAAATVCAVPHPAEAATALLPASDVRETETMAAASSAQSPAVLPLGSKDHQIKPDQEQQPSTISGPCASLMSSHAAQPVQRPQSSSLGPSRGSLEPPAPPVVIADTTTASSTGSLVPSRILVAPSVSPLALPSVGTAGLGENIVSIFDPKGVPSSSLVASNPNQQRKRTRFARSPSADSPPNKLLRSSSPVLRTAVDVSPEAERLESGTISQELGTPLEPIRDLAEGNDSPSSRSPSDPGQHGDNALSITALQPSVFSPVAGDTARFVQSPPLIRPVEPFANQQFGTVKHSISSSSQAQLSGALVSSPMCMPPSATTASLLAWQNRLKHQGPGASMSELVQDLAVHSSGVGGLFPLQYANGDGDIVLGQPMNSGLAAGNSDPCVSVHGQRLFPGIRGELPPECLEKAVLPSSDFRSDMERGIVPNPLQSTLTSTTSEPAIPSPSALGLSGPSLQCGTRHSSRVEATVAERQCSAGSASETGSQSLISSLETSERPSCAETHPPTSPLCSSPNTPLFATVESAYQPSADVSSPVVAGPSSEQLRNNANDHEIAREESYPGRSDIASDPIVPNTMVSASTAPQYELPGPTKSENVAGQIANQLPQDRGRSTVSPYHNGVLRAGKAHPELSEVPHLAPTPVVSMKGRCASADERTLASSMVDVMSAICRAPLGHGDLSAIDRCGVQICDDVIRRARLVQNCGLSSKSGWAKRFIAISNSGGPRELTKQLTLLAKQCETMARRLRSDDLNRVDVRPLFESIADANIVPVCETIVAASKRMTEKGRTDHGFVNMWIYILSTISYIHSNILSEPECIVQSSENARRVAKALKEVLVLKVVTSEEKKRIQRVVKVMLTSVSARSTSKTSKAAVATDDAIKPAVPATSLKKRKKELLGDAKEALAHVSKAAQEVTENKIVEPEKVLKKSNAKVDVSDIGDVGSVGSVRGQDRILEPATIEEVRVPRVPRAQSFAQQAFANLVPSGATRSPANVDGKVVQSHRDPTIAASNFGSKAPLIRRFDDMKKKTYAPPKPDEHAPRPVYRGGAPSDRRKGNRRVSFGGFPAFAGYDSCVTEVVEINTKEADNPFKNVMDVLHPDVPEEFSEVVARRAAHVPRRMFLSTLGGILTNIAAQRAAREGLPFAEQAQYFSGHMQPPADAIE
jgi:hypothetical protein